MENVLALNISYLRPTDVTPALGFCNIEASASQAIKMAVSFGLLLVKTQDYLGLFDVLGLSRLKASQRVSLDAKVSVLHNYVSG